MWPPQLQIRDTAKRGQQEDDHGPDLSGEAEDYVGTLQFAQAIDVKSDGQDEYDDRYERTLGSHADSVTRLIAASST